MLLDFEKAYDRVCWDFLKSVIGKLGFQDLWIKDIATLYKKAKNCASIVGEGVPFFQISRFVGQRWLLAPSLFLLHVEAFSSLLHSRHLNLQGLRSCTLTSASLI